MDECLRPPDSTNRESTDRPRLSCERRPTVRLSAEKRAQTGQKCTFFQRNKALWAHLREVLYSLLAPIATLPTANLRIRVAQSVNPSKISNLLGKHSSGRHNPLSAHLELTPHR